MNQPARDKNNIEQTIEETNAANASEEHVNGIDITYSLKEDPGEQPRTEVSSIPKLSRLLFLLLMLPAYRLTI